MRGWSRRRSRSVWGGLLVLWACVLGLETWAVAGQSVIYAFTNFVGSPPRTGSADGAGKAALFFYPWFVSIGPDGTLYVADTYNNTIRKVTPSGAVTTLAGAPGQTGIADGT